MHTEARRGCVSQDSVSGQDPSSLPQDVSHWEQALGFFGFFLHPRRPQYSLQIKWVL